MEEKRHHQAYWEGSELKDKNPKSFPRNNIVISPPKDQLLEWPQTAPQKCLGKKCEVLEPCVREEEGLGLTG